MLSRRRSKPLALVLSASLLGGAAAVSTRSGRETEPPGREAAALAVRRILPLLQKSGQTWLDRSNCTSCHHQALSFMALSVAKENGFRIDEAALRRQAKESNKRRGKYTLPMYELTGAINAVSGHGYQVLGLAALRSPATEFTDAAGFYLTGVQSTKGFWPSLSHRPPLEDSPFTMTALAVRALRIYPPKQGGEEAIARARKWLVATSAPHAEARAMRLFGLFWSDAPSASISEARRAILAHQRSDGGWSQLPGMRSDAYATGQALVALRVAGGLPVSSPTFVSGARYLLSTQLRDGSWRVTTRRVFPGLPYFETGFPHGIDQFISYAGSAWSTAALTVFATDGSVRALSDLSPRRRAESAPRLAKGWREERLFRAAIYGNVAEVQRAIRAGASPNARSLRGATPLMFAVRDPKKVAALLKLGADPNLRSARNSTALLIAATTRNGMPSMRLLLAAGADPNLGRKGTGEFPLNAAALSLDREKIDLLLAKGAKFTGECIATLTYAEATGDEDAVAYLVKKGNGINSVEPQFGATVLNFAVSDHAAGVVDRVLKLGGDPNIPDMEGWSPLQGAAAGDPGDSKIVAMLIAAGAKLDYRTKERPRAYELAVRKGNQESARLLREAESRITTSTQK